MKKIYTIISAAIIAASLTSCEDRLDYVPKGESTLSSLDDIELLLNNEMTLSKLSDLSLICNDAYPAFEDVNTILSATNTENYVYLTYDESKDRTQIVNNDDRYNQIYSNINYNNIVIEKAEQASGDAAQKARLIAEAKLLRAYYHYILVNIYAAQYDASTAKDKGGIPYVNSSAMGETKVKLSLEEVYNHLLEDCSEDVIKDMKDYVPDVCRVDKAFGYGVRAKVLFQMKRYSEALEAAQKAIKFNNNLEDRSTTRDNGSWVLDADSPNNYFYCKASFVRACPCYEVIPPECVAFFDENDYTRLYAYDYFGESVWSEFEAEIYNGVPGGLAFCDFGPWFNSGGIRTENMYFIIAESLIHTGKIREGLDYIDRVRVRRIENPEMWTAKYDAAPMSEKDAVELLRQFSYIEFFTGYDTFFNMKRWNSCPEYARTITRTLEGYGTYSLRPDSPLWILPFPQNAVRYNPTLTQNF